jgi:glucose/arabinose dehydrogenase
MPRSLILRGLGAASVLALAACSSGPTLPAAAGFGPSPQLPPPHKALIPTLKIAKAVGWRAGEAPTPAPGFVVQPFATGLTHPRWLLVLPNGDVLVAETNGPGYEKDKSLRGLIQSMVMKSAGAKVPSPNRITLLRDADGDGKAEIRTVFLQGLNSPFGMALVGEELYVADTDKVLRFPYQAGQTAITAAPAKLIDLPALPLDHHWTKNILASRDGSRLYATVGSNSNIADHGMQIEAGRAAIWEIDRTTARSRLFATGMRNPNGMAWQPQTGELWTVVNERDEIGNDLVPDYLTSVKDGGFYGWPYSYWGGHVDLRAKPQRPDLVASAIVPDYGLSSHTASLGLAFYDAAAFPARYRGGAFVGQHGSWNRSVLNGYKVIFVPFQNGRPSGPPEDVLTGFVDAAGHARGRPVGVAVDKAGALLVADDVGDTVWRVTPAAR